jgi:drug/metabolite transporter (DMT)-like permease
MLVASLCFAIMGACVKAGATRFAPAELVFYRGLIATAALWGFVALRGRPLATPHWRAQLSRGVSGLVALVLFFLSISNLPLATAVTLNYTSPLFFGLLLVFWARERLALRLAAALVLGFCGVVLLLQPTLQRDQIWFALGSLLSGFLAAVAYLNVRNLGDLGEPEWRTVFYFSLITTLGALPWLAGSGSFHAVDGAGFAILMGVGIFGGLAQLAMTRAYRYGKTLVSASLAYTTVVFSALLGVFVWDEMLVPLAWVGIAVVVASGLAASMASGGAGRQRDGRGSVIVGSAHSGAKNDRH